MTGKKGKIYLVGAGPGDPDLVTIKAVRAIERADVLVYDYLASKVLLEYAHEGCEKIYVGKKGGSHTMPQAEINSLIVEHARRGAVVTRLKGGDPFVFGRGGEEALEAAREGVEFEVVPGVTAGIAAPAFAGIPVSHRSVASAVAFITGHEDPGKEKSDIDWEGLAKFSGTLVFYMGLSRLSSITGRLLDQGMDPGTPVAVIHRGTTGEQKTVTGCLAGDGESEAIENKVRDQGLSAPAVIVVGKVVELRRSLNWYETRPLFGRTVLVTRALEQASEFSRILEDYGARVIELPAIRIGDSPDPEAVQTAVESLCKFDWIIFTSSNGVERFLKDILEGGRDVRALGSAKLCAIGPGTRRALEALGLRVELVPGSYVAEALVEALKGRGELKGQKILLPRAESARAVIPEALRGLGAEVIEVPVYSTQMEAPENLGQVRADLEQGKIDVLTFTSSSTVDNFIKMVGEPAVSNLSRDVLVASIGPVTAQSAKKHGLETRIMPEDYTVEALAAAIRDHFRGTLYG